MKNSTRFWAIVSLLLSRSLVDRQYSYASLMISSFCPSVTRSSVLVQAAFDRFFAKWQGQHKVAMFDRSHRPPPSTTGTM